MDVKGFLVHMIDQIFAPPLSFINLGIDKLDNINLVTAQGLNVGQYLNVFGDMPQSWQLVIQSLLISISTIGSIIIFKAVMRLYYAIKGAIQWW